MRCRDTSSHDGETAQVSLLFPLFIRLLTVKEGDRSSVYYTGSDFAVYSSLLTATHCFAITNNASSSLARPSSTAGSRRCDCMDKHSLPITNYANFDALNVTRRLRDEIILIIHGSENR